MDYTKLSVEELVTEVNKQLELGETLSSLQKKHGLRAKYISDKFKNKYVKDKATNKYIPKEIEIVTPSYTVTTSEVAPIEKNEVVTSVVTEVVTSQFVEDEVEILKKIIAEYRTKQMIQEQMQDDEDKQDLANRNIRVYTKQYNKFADWCKSNNITQADALYKAIQMLMAQ